MQFGKLISNVKLLWVMKNVRWFSDKQLYQLCIGCTSLQLSLFRQIQTHTDRYSSSVIFFYFPVICSRWEHNLLCVLTACVQHALIFFAIKSDRNPKHLFLLLLSLLCKLYFCRGAKDSGKDAEQRNARTGQCSLLAYFGCFYFMFLAMGISLPPQTDWQQNPRLPHLILTVTADAVTRLPGCCLWEGDAAGKRGI